MDTTTVLEIIKMIDAGIFNLDNLLHDTERNVSDDYLKGGMHQLSGLKNHLQDYIEQQLSAAENSTGE